MCERELGTEQGLQHIDPQPLLAMTAFLSVLLGCSTGVLEAQSLLGHGFHSSFFSPTALNFLSPGLYNNLTPTYFLRASHLYSIQIIDSHGIPWSPDIFNWMHLLFTQVHFFFFLSAWPGSICNMIRSFLGGYFPSVTITEQLKCKLFLLRYCSPSRLLLCNGYSFIYQ